jgi:hypothetical protein
MNIESYRTRLEEFEQNQNRELYDYYSGRKKQPDILSVYADYSDLFSAESIREVESELKNTGDTFRSKTDTSVGREGNSPHSSPGISTGRTGCDHEAKTE